MKTAQHVACVAEEPLMIQRHDQRLCALQSISRCGNTLRAADAGLDSICELGFGSNSGAHIFSGKKMCAAFTRRHACRIKSICLLEPLQDAAGTHCFQQHILAMSFLGRFKTAAAPAPSRESVVRVSNARENAKKPILLRAHTSGINDLASDSK